LFVCLLVFGAPSALATNCTSCTWNGTGTTPNWSNSANWVGANSPSTTDTLLAFPALTGCVSPDTCYASDNDITGLTTNQLTVEDNSPYIISGSPFTLGSGGLTGTTTSTAGPTSGPPDISNAITLGNPQPWSISAPTNGSGEVDVTGQVTGPTANTLAVSLSNGTLGLGSFGGPAIDDEVGAVTITTPSTFFGTLDLFRGTSLNGTNHNLISISNAGLLAEGGNTTGPLTLTGGGITIVPFSFGGTPATLTVNGGVTLSSSSFLSLAIFGSGSPPTAGTDYTQLTASGPVNLGGALLELSQQGGATSCPALHVGDVYTLVTTSGALTGTFTDPNTGNPIANGSTIQVPCFSGGAPSNVPMRINYTSNSVTATVVSGTTTTISASPSSSVTNQPVTLTATVTPSYGSSAPTGTVEFDNNGTAISGCSAQPVNSSGTATCTTSFAASSPPSLTAKYTPSSGSGFNPSTSSALSFAVSKDSTATGLSVSNTAPGEGQSVTYTATVVPAHSGSVNPTGTVQFSDNGTAISGCSAQPLSSSGTASCTTSYSSPGSHGITATYSGDGNFTGSVSSGQTVTVSNPAPPAISATTKPAAPVGTTTATLNGVVDTKGAAVTWQFQFGQSIAYNKATPIQTIAAGQSQPVAVSWKLIDLLPNTTYHFRLVAVTQASSSPVKSEGVDLTFTTKPTGKLLLTFNQLKVIGGFVFIPLKCQSRLACNGLFSITTKTMVGKRGHRHLATVLCSTKFFKIKAGKTVKFKTKVYTACLSLLKHAKGHRIKAQFTSRPRTGQLGIIKTIFLHF